MATAYTGRTPMLDAATTPRIHTPQPVSHDHRGCYGNSPRVGWIVAATHSQAEPWANSNLQRRGYETYLPLVLRQRRDRVLPTLVHHLLVPLFRGYLFVRYDSRDPRRPIRETPGVRDLIRCGSEVQFVPDGAVSALQASEEARRSLAPASSPWRPGMACRVATGIMAGFPGVVIYLAGDTALVSLMFLGQLREISLPLEYLMARDDD